MHTALLTFMLGTDITGEAMVSFTSRYSKLKNRRTCSFIHVPRPDLHDKLGSGGLHMSVWVVRKTSGYHDRRM